MSGVEAAGFVLAVIPLIISGLEHYAEGAESIRVAWNYSREFKSLAWNLEAHNTCFRNSIEILLGDCVDIDDQKRLMDNIGGKNWSDPAIAEALRRRLRGSYEPYVNTVISIAGAVSALQRRLQLGQNKVPIEDRRSLKRACKALYFALRKDSYMDLIKIIRDGNVVVERLCTQTRTLEAQSKTRRLPDFDKTRAETTSIFESLQKGLRATCSMPHRVDLYLNFDGDQRTPKVRISSDTQPSFRIILAHEFTIGKQRAPPWAIEEAEIRLFDLASPSAPPQPSAQQSWNDTLPNRPRKPVIQFREPTQSVPRPDSKPCTQQSQLSSPAIQQQNVKEIQDICESIQRYRSMQRGTCLGYMTGACSRRRHELYWPNQRLLDRTMTLSLAHILQKPTEVGCKLRHADAHRIAVSLASAVLRLHDTPWLPKEWSKSDIILMSQNGKVSSDRPFISRALRAVGPTDPQNATQLATLAQRVIRNPTLFRLGILLIELCMEKPMHELHLPEDLDTDGKINDFSDYHAATRLLDLEEIRDRFGKRWSEVVSHCIFCPKPSLQDIDLRRDIYTNVVLELQEASRQFFDEP